MISRGAPLAPFLRGILSSDISISEVVKALPDSVVRDISLVYMCIAYLEYTPSYSTIRYYWRPEIYNDRGKLLLRSFPRKVVYIVNITGLFGV